jgi:predicted transposase YbfD/YdcC
VDNKTNEITAIPELLTMLDIENSIVTLDAMGCQREIAQQIVKQKADYILALKGNHSGMQAELAAWWHKSMREGLSDKVYSKHTETNSGHGRIKKRTCQQLLVKKNWLDKKYQ